MIIEITFCDFLISMAIRCIQINSFNQLHIIKKRIKSHKIGKTDFFRSMSSTNCLQKAKQKKIINKCDFL